MTVLSNVASGFNRLVSAVLNLKTQVDAIPIATPVVATKTTIVGLDKIILLDSDNGFSPYTATKDQLLDGVGGAVSIPDLTPLGLWDFWYYYRITTTGVAASDMFIGAPVSSGTNTTGLLATGQAGYNSHGVYLRSSTTPNGGYRYYASSLVADYFGAISKKFRVQFMWKISFTGRTARTGFLDTATSVDSTDGAYFEILDNVCSAKTANNSVRTTNAVTVTLSLDVAYTFDIDVNKDGTEARFRVYAGNDNTPIMDVVNTTNIPVVVLRAFGIGFIITEVSATASDMGVIYGIGTGTIEAFQTRDVASILGDIDSVLASI